MKGGINILQNLNNRCGVFQIFVFLKKVKNKTKQNGLMVSVYWSLEREKSRILKHHSRHANLNQFMPPIKPCSQLKFYHCCHILIGWMLFIVHFSDNLRSDTPNQAYFFSL